MDPDDRDEPVPVPAEPLRTASLLLRRASRKKGISAELHRLAMLPLRDDEWRIDGADVEGSGECSRMLAWRDMVAACKSARLVVRVDDDDEG